MHKPVFVDKAHPYVVFEIPVNRPWGTINPSADLFGGVFMITPVGNRDATNPPVKMANVAILTMAGDDFRMSHIRSGVNGIVADTDNGEVFPPWNY